MYGPKALYRSLTAMKVAGRKKRVTVVITLIETVSCFVFMARSCIFRVIVSMRAAHSRDSFAQNSLALELRCCNIPLTCVMPYQCMSMLQCCLSCCSFFGKCLVAALLLIAAAFLVDFIGLAWVFTRKFPILRIEFESIVLTKVFRLAKRCSRVSVRDCSMRRSFSTPTTPLQK